MKVRIRSYTRLLLALVLAPMVATFFFPVGNCLVGLFGSGMNCVAGLTGYAWYGLPPAALATAFLGVPLLFVILRAGWVKAWQFVMGGGGIGVCASMLLGLADHHLKFFGMLTIAIPIGAVAAGVLWLVGVRKNLLCDPTIS